MRIKILSAVILWVVLSAVSTDAINFKQTDVQSFWKNFKSAIAKNDKNALVEMTKFPLSMPYGVKSLKSKTDFLKRYNEIFKGEADAARCFPKAKLEKENAKRYVVYCGFKATPNDEENKPIAYHFELTKTGWKFTGLDNINE
jgi:hypothetical protein